MQSKYENRKYVGRLLATVAGTIALALAGLYQPSQAMAGSALTIEQFTAPPEAAAVNSYLIQSDKELVVVDGQFVVPVAQKLVEKIKATGKTPKAFILTHVHPDHFFGFTVLQEAFPGVPLYASAGVKADFDAIAQPTLDHMKGMMGDKIPATVATVQVLPNNKLELGGQEIMLEELQGGEHSVSALVHVKSLNAVLAGDNLYNNTHMWMAECGSKEWVAHLEKFKSLKKTTFYPGHGAGSGGKDMVQWNIDYLKKFDAAMAPIQATDPKAFVESATQAMVKAYPKAEGQALLGMYLPRYMKCSGKMPKAN